MSRAVRNALVFAGAVTLIWILLALAWRIARWLLIVSTWAVAFTIAGLILLVRPVMHRFPRLISFQSAKSAQLDGGPRK